MTKLLSYAEAKAKGHKHFFTGRACQRGHVAKRYTSTRACHECARIASAVSQRLNYRLTYKLGGKAWVRGLMKAAKARAEQYGIPFDRAAVVEFLNSPPTHCPALGVELRPGGGRSFDSPTLDRIRPELGYVRGNLALLSSRANAIKSDASAEEVQKVATWLKQLQQKGLAHK